MWYRFVVILLWTLMCNYCCAQSAHRYQVNDTLPLMVNKLTSDITQIPFAYGELDFTCPSYDIDRRKQRSITNLGHILQGDRYMKSQFELFVGHNSYCNRLCSINTTANSMLFASELISLDYSVEWLVDGLPGGSYHNNKWQPSFKLGYLNAEQHNQPILYTHFDLHILYQTDPANKETMYIVGFNVYPAAMDVCKSSKATTQSQTEFEYTYSVIWTKTTEVTWKTRWDRYNYAPPARIYYRPILCVMTCTLLLTCIAGLVLHRILCRDISVYNRESKDEYVSDCAANGGWKMMHGDVFRPPMQSTWLGPLLGSGMQFINMSMFTLLVGLVGLLNPSYINGFISYTIALYLLSGLFTGYTSNLIHHVLKADTTAWTQNAFVAAFLVPSVIFAIVFLVNLFVWNYRGSSAIPLSTFTALIFLWFVISVPVVYLGAYVSQKGHRKKSFVPPVTISQLPRYIPQQPWYATSDFRCLVGGTVLFIFLFLNMHYVALSVWNEKYHYLCGVLIAMAMLLALVSAIMSIAITYFSLCCHDYRWWWNSFRISCVSSVYLFLYAAYYYTCHFDTAVVVSAVVYLGRAAILCLVYGLCMGTIGFFFTYGFMRSIYTSIKID